MSLTINITETASFGFLGMMQAASPIDRDVTLVS
jgi:hypothetical protein